MGWDGMRCDVWVNEWFFAVRVCDIYCVLTWIIWFLCQRYWCELWGSKFSPLTQKCREDAHNSNNNWTGPEHMFWWSENVCAIMDQWLGFSQIRKSANHFDSQLICGDLLSMISHAGCVWVRYFIFTYKSSTFLYLHSWIWFHPSLSDPSLSFFLFNPLHAPLFLRSFSLAFFLSLLLLLILFKVSCFYSNSVFQI